MNDLRDMTATAAMTTKATRACEEEGNSGAVGLGDEPEAMDASVRTETVLPLASETKSSPLKKSYARGPIATFKFCTTESVVSETTESAS